jgi:DNA-binding MarR family transcriptional regulator
MMHARTQVSLPAFAGVATTPRPSGHFDSFLGDAQPLTISRLGEGLLVLFFAPGDWLLWTVVSYAPPVAAFLEISAADYGGVLSGFISALAWLAALVIVSVVAMAVRDFDQALTCRIVQWHQDVRRRIRVASNLIGFRWRRLAERRGSQRRRVEPTIELSEELDVSVAELRVLHAHSELPPGYALPLSDAAVRLGAAKADVERMLSRLKQLNLLCSTVGGLDGESAYTLTAAGRAFLQFRRMKGATARLPPQVSSSLRPAPAQRVSPPRISGVS